MTAGAMTNGTAGAGSTRLTFGVLAGGVLVTIVAAALLEASSGRLDGRPASSTAASASPPSPPSPPMLPSRAQRRVRTRSAPGSASARASRSGVALGITSRSADSSRRRW
jgi:hypothetical protein